MVARFVRKYHEWHEMIVACSELLVVGSLTKSTHQFNLFNAANLN